MVTLRAVSRTTSRSRSTSTSSVQRRDKRQSGSKRQLRNLSNTSTNRDRKTCQQQNESDGSSDRSTSEHPGSGSKRRRASRSSVEQESDDEDGGSNSVDSDDDEGNDGNGSSTSSKDSGSGWESIEEPRLIHGRTMSEAEAAAAKAAAAFFRRVNPSSPKCSDGKMKQNKNTKNNHEKREKQAQPVEERGRKLRTRSMVERDDDGNVSKRRSGGSTTKIIRHDAMKKRRRGSSSSNQGTRQARGEITETRNSILESVCSTSSSSDSSSSHASDAPPQADQEHKQHKKKNVNGSKNNKPDAAAAAIVSWGVLTGGSGGGIKANDGGQCSHAFVFEDDCEIKAVVVAVLGINEMHREMRGGTCEYDNGSCTAMGQIMCTTCGMLVCGTGKGAQAHARKHWEEAGHPLQVRLRDKELRCRPCRAQIRPSKSSMLDTLVVKMQAAPPYAKAGRARAREIAAERNAAKASGGGSAVSKGVARKGNGTSSVKLRVRPPVMSVDTRRHRRRRREMSSEEEEEEEEEESSEEQESSEDEEEEEEEIEQEQEVSKRSKQQQTGNVKQHQQQHPLRISASPTKTASRDATARRVQAVPNGAVGLSNLGNSCFMNSVVQALSNTDIFREAVLRDVTVQEEHCSGVTGTGLRSLTATPHATGHENNNKNARRNSALHSVSPRYLRTLIHNNVNSIGAGAAPVVADKEMETSLYLEWVYLMRTLWEPHLTVSLVEPKTFFSAVTRVMPYFGGYAQQDAHEFLRYLCDRLHWECSLREDVDETRGATGKHMSRRDHHEHHPDDSIASRISTLNFDEEEDRDDGLKKDVDKQQVMGGSNMEKVIEIPPSIKTAVVLGVSTNAPVAARATDQHSNVFGTGISSAGKSTIAADTVDIDKIGAGNDVTPALDEKNGSPDDVEADQASVYDAESCTSSPPPHSPHSPRVAVSNGVASSAAVPVAAVAAAPRDNHAHSPRVVETEKSTTDGTGTGAQAPPPHHHNHNRPSLIKDIFGCTLLNEMECLRCGYVSRKSDPCLDLSLDIPEALTKVFMTSAACPSTGMDIDEAIAANEESEEMPDSSGESSSDSMSSDTSRCGSGSQNASTSSASQADGNVAVNGMYINGGNVNEKRKKKEEKKKKRMPFYPRPYRLSDCLANFTRTEHLRDDEQYVCANCRGLGVSKDTAVVQERKDGRTSSSFSSSFSPVGVLHKTTHDEKAAALNTNINSNNNSNNTNDNNNNNNNNTNNVNNNIKIKVETSAQHTESATASKGTGVTRSLRIQSLPKVLCVQLKRFHWTYTSHVKVKRYVQFPIRGLDMSKYCAIPSSDGDDNQQDSRVFDLYAVIVHHGSGFESGHYTAYCRNHATGQWWHFDDSAVAPVDEEVVARSQAYLLFYESRAVAKAGLAAAPSALAHVGHRSPRAW